MSASNIDIQALLREATRGGGQRSAASDRYFMVEVQKVAESQKTPGLFRVSGTKLETGTPVVVFVTKSSSGQNIPEVGGMLRADKANKQSAGDYKVDVYKAEYFHAYPASDLCMKATAKPEVPRQKGEKKYWSASVDFSHEGNPAQVTLLDVATPERLAKTILPLLKPWENQEDKTGDLKNKSLWDNPRRGICPHVAFRVNGMAYGVFGAGAVEVNNKLVWPSDETIMNSVAKSIQNRVGLSRFLKTVAPVAAEHPAALQAHSVEIVPCTRINVGRESLAGVDEKYLPTPEFYRFKNEKRKSPSDPEMLSGWCESYVHVKATKDNIFVVNMVPVGGSSMHKGLPYTANEKAAAELANQEGQGVEQQAQAQPKQAQQAQQTQQQPTPQQAEPQQQVPQQQVPQQQEPQQSQYDDMPDFADDFSDSMEDFDSYSSDLAAMEAMNAEPAGTQEFEDDDFDDLIAQAEEKVQKRHAPRM